MNDVLNEFGFQHTENFNEYRKGNWTVRFVGDNVEAFNNPDLEVGKYFSAPIEKIDLQQLLIEIDDFIMQ